VSTFRLLHESPVSPPQLLAQVVEDGRRVVQFPVRVVVVRGQVVDRVHGDRPLPLKLNNVLLRHLSLRAKIQSWKAQGQGYNTVHSLFLSTSSTLVGYIKQLLSLSANLLSLSANLLSLSANLQLHGFLL
jgi:hypothetical protein